jgi:hypothetical protein
MATQVQRREQIVTEKINVVMGTHYQWVGGRLKKWDAEDILTGEKIEHKTALRTSSGWVIHPYNMATLKNWCFSLWEGYEDSLEETLLAVVYVPKEHVHKFMKFMEPRLLDKVVRNKQNKGTGITKNQLLSLFDFNEVRVYNFANNNKEINVR